MANRVQRVKPVWKSFWDEPGVIRQFNLPDATVVNGSIDLIDELQVLDEMDDSALVKRVVGEVHFWWVAGEAFALEDLEYMWLHMGILEEDAQYNALSVTPDNPVDIQDGKWAWLRTYCAPGQAAGDQSSGAVGGNTSWSSDAGGLLSTHIDIKVVRKLGSGSALRLKMAAQCQGIDTDLEFTVNLRILCEV